MDVNAFGGGFGSSVGFGQAQAFGAIERYAKVAQTLAAPNAATHGVTSQNITLVQQHTLVVQSASHSTKSDNVTVTQKHNLTVQNATHGLTSPQLNLIYNTLLTVQNAVHSVQSPTVVVVQQHTIAVQNSAHTTKSDNITVTQKHVLAIQNALHALKSQNITTVQHFTLATPDPAVHGVISPEFPLIQDFKLVVDNSEHRLVDNMRRILYWASYQKYFGNYGWELTDSGELGQAEIANQQIGVKIIETAPLTVAEGSTGNYGETKQETGSYR